MPAPEPIPDLLKAVNEASGKAFALWVTFLTVGIYLAITVGTTTDLQLLLGAPVKLPLLGVDMPLVAFYSFAPLMFVALLLYVLMQLYLLANLLRLFDDDLRAADMIEQERRAIRAQLDKFVFTQYLVGAPQENFVRRLMWAVVWLSFVAGPVLLLFGFLIRFLPYRAFWVTDQLNRFPVLLDIWLLWQLWPEIDTDVQKLLGAKLWKRVFFFLIAVPWSAAQIWPQAFSHLVLENERLVEPDKVKLDNLTVTLSLRGRNLEFASFRGSDLRKADFFGADLRGAEFSDAKLANTVLRDAELGESTLKGVDLSGANLSGAHLWRADLSGADLGGADLSDADLNGARNLSQEQLSQACGKPKALPPYLTLDRPCPAPPGAR
jgi:hypothetical protein